MLGLAKANKDILVNDRLVDGTASDGMSSVCLWCLCSDYDHRFCEAHSVCHGITELETTKSHLIAQLIDY